MPATLERDAMVREDAAFSAFLAALADRGMVQIAGPSQAVHSAFRLALETLQADETLGRYFAHYFPSRITGRIDELDQALVRGESAGIVQYGNPTYSRIQISLTPYEVERLLDQFPDQRATLQTAAGAFERRFREATW